MSPEDRDVFERYVNDMARAIPPDSAPLAAAIAGFHQGLMAADYHDADTLQTFRRIIEAGLAEGNGMAAEQIEVIGRAGWQSRDWTRSA